MDSRAAIKVGIDTGDMIAMSYLADLSDQDLMRRPHPGCNHINWQVGHLIASENDLISQVVPGAMPALPAGFADKYTKSTTSSDKASDFATKSDLMRAYQEQHAATLAALSNLSDDDLSRPSGVEYSPTVGGVFSLIGSHWLMHAGQWVIVRRELGKPALF